MNQNGVAEITVGPRHPDKPFGIAARYFDAEGEEMFCQGFDQNDSAEWIRSRVAALLTEGIANRIAANTTSIAAEELEAAVAAGYTTAAEHQAAIAAAKQADIDAKEALWQSTINDPIRAARAEGEMRALLPVMAAHPAPEGFEWRMDRSGRVGCYGANGRLLDDHPKTGSIDRDDLRAWLHQHGFSPTIDNRMALFNAVV